MDRWNGEHLLWYFDKLQFWRPKKSLILPIWSPPKFCDVKQKRCASGNWNFNACHHSQFRASLKMLGISFSATSPWNPGWFLPRKILSKDIQRTSQNFRCNAHLFINLRLQPRVYASTWHKQQTVCVCCLTASVSRSCSPSNCSLCELACLIQCWLTMARPLELALLSMICQFYLRSPKAGHGFVELLRIWYSEVSCRLSATLSCYCMCIYLYI